MNNDNIIPREQDEQQWVMLGEEEFIEFMRRAIANEGVQCESKEEKPSR